MKEQVLEDATLRILRDKGLLTEEEVALQCGDKIVAENVLSRERRVLNVGLEILSENGPRLLKS
jgi:hypothetical protein